MQYPQFIMSDASAGRSCTRWRTSGGWHRRRRVHRTAGSTRRSPATRRTCTSAIREARCGTPNWPLDGRGSRTRWATGPASVRALDRWLTASACALTVGIARPRCGALMQRLRTTTPSNMALGWSTTDAFKVEAQAVAEQPAGPHRPHVRSGYHPPDRRRPVSRRRRGVSSANGRTASATAWQTPWRTACHFCCGWMNTSSNGPVRPSMMTPASSASSRPGPQPA